MRVLQTRRRADLALEALWPQRGGQLWMQDLEGDLAVVLEVVCEVHRGHATPPQLTLEPVAVSQATLEALGKVGQRSGL